ncbi:MAG: hypothetical protein ACRD1T_08385 [Acidimicrobiia bacterium]
MNESAAGASIETGRSRLFLGAAAAFLVASLLVGVVQVLTLTYWVSAVLELPGFLIAAWLGAKISSRRPVAAVVLAFGPTYGLIAVVTGLVNWSRGDGFRSEVIIAGYVLFAIVIAFTIRARLERPDDT